MATESAFCNFHLTLCNKGKFMQVVHTFLAENTSLSTVLV